jgi:ParB-like chromosome segregation protein Spo0J
MRTARALLPLKRQAKVQRELLAKIVKEELSAGQVAALVAKRVYGAGAIAPLRYSVRGAGRVDAKTTRSGKLRVVLEAEDRAGLAKLLSSVRKKIV